MYSFRYLFVVFPYNSSYVLWGPNVTVPLAAGGVNITGFKPESLHTMFVKVCYYIFQSMFSYVQCEVFATLTLHTMCGEGEWDD